MTDDRFIIILTHITGIQHTILLLAYLVIAGLVLWQIVARKQNGVFTGMLILLITYIIQEAWIAARLAMIVFFTHQYDSPAVLILGIFSGMLHVIALVALAWIVMRSK